MKRSGGIFWEILKRIKKTDTQMSAHVGKSTVYPGKEAGVIHKAF